MPIEFPIFSLVLLLAAGQGLFLSLLLIFARKGNWRANRYLGLFTLAIVITMVDFAIDNAVSNNGALNLRTLFWPRDYLYGPAIYFYIREMTLPGRYPLFLRQWLHFLPAFLHMAYFWSLPFLNTQLLAAVLVDDDSAPLQVQALASRISIIEIVTSICHVTVYLWLSVRCLLIHRERIKLTFSYKERVSLIWLRNLLYGVIAVYLIWIVDEIVGGLLDDSGVVYIVLGASLVVLVYTMSYLGLRQPVIFTSETVSMFFEKNSNPTNVSLTTKTKYKTSALSDDLSQQLIIELKELMETEKPYLDSQLSLPQLAEKLGVSAHYLSQIINEQLEQNFFEFVNSFRVSEAKVILSDSARKKENILTVALEVGFNSKSSFYTAFKKRTGLTPGEFRKQASHA